jgi:hypothetical protein
MSTEYSQGQIEFAEYFTRQWNRLPDEVRENLSRQKELSKKEDVEQLRIILDSYLDEGENLSTGLDLPSKVIVTNNNKVQKQAFNWLRWTSLIKEAYLLKKIVEENNGRNISLKEPECYEGFNSDSNWDERLLPNACTLETDYLRNKNGVPAYDFKTLIYNPNIGKRAIFAFLQYISLIDYVDFTKKYNSIEKDDIKLVVPEDNRLKVFQHREDDLEDRLEDAKKILFESLDIIESRRKSYLEFS